MKSPESYQLLKWKLVKGLVIFFLGISLSNISSGNPIQMPPSILEIYFGPSEGDWSIELLISEFYGECNLDDMRLKSMNDSALFLPGITFSPGEAFIITQDDLQTPFYINQDGDWLLLEEYIEEFNIWWIYDLFGLPFGTIQGESFCDVSAPVGEESIAWQEFSWSNGGPYFWTVKELPNTIGYSPLEVSKRATFTGSLKDKNSLPLAGVKLDYCAYEFYHYTTPTVPEIITDENGHFFTESMFCKKYTINFMYNDGQIGDTVIFVEPDSANYFEFKLDTLLTGIGENKSAGSGYAIRTIPNPSSFQTSFVVESPNTKPVRKGVIKIYSEAGFIVDIIPIEILSEKQELLYNFQDKSFASGLYIYYLEIGHQKMASGKMMINR